MNNLLASNDVHDAAFFEVTKTYGHDQGLSATFRQWRAKSHCRFLHGYALAVTLTFGCAASELDENGWVMNFGALKPIKQWLQDTFDHKTLVAKDDPCLEFFRQMAREETGLSADREWNIHPPLIQLVEVERTGCEAFAKMIFEYVNAWLEDPEATHGSKAKLLSVEVREHGANGASYCA